MRKSYLLLLLLMFSIGIQAQSIKVDKQDKFTGLNEKRTSFEKIVSDPLIMGGKWDVIFGALSKLSKIVSCHL